MKNKSQPSPRLRVAADIGGTFTDVAAFDAQAGKLLLGKTLTTPSHLVQGILKGLEKADISLDLAHLFLHGSTVAINTMLERSGARTALITTKGFRDIYEIGRINRPDSFNLKHRKHVPLVERDMRFEITERLLADGSVHEPLDLVELEDLIDQLAGLNLDAVAVLFLHSYRNPSHERIVKDRLLKRLPNLYHRLPIERKAEA